MNPNRNGFQPPKVIRGVLIVLVLFILVVFIVDKLVMQPPRQTGDLAVAVAHLQRHDVRRVTIPANTVTLELNDGKRITASVPGERDLWPLIRSSGADVSLTSAGSPADERTGFTYYAFQFVPFVIMGLLLVFILRTVRRPG